MLMLLMPNERQGASAPLRPGNMLQDFKQLLSGSSHPFVR